jgi:hypothetical protein
MKARAAQRSRERIFAFRQGSEERARRRAGARRKSDAMSNAAGE